MNHPLMPLLSILYQLMRCLLGLNAVLVRRDLSKEAELLALRHENAVLRRQVSWVRYTPRPGVAGRLVPVVAAPLLGRGLRGHSRHPPGLALQAGLAQMGLHRTPPARTSTGQPVTAEDQDVARSPVAQLGENRQPELCQNPSSTPERSYLWELEVSPVRNSTTSPSAIT
jgi:hypothetical protein